MLPKCSEIARTRQKLQKQSSFEASNPELFQKYMGKYSVKTSTEHDGVTCETHLSIL